MLNALEVLVRVTFEKPNRFVCICDWKDREIPRRAKFLWSADDKYWYTTTFEHAAKLRTYFDKPLRDKTNRVSVVEVPWSSRVPILAMGQAAKPHQIEGFNFAMSRNHSYLAFDMGLGKSATSIMVINQLYLENKAAKVLIIVPPFLITNWIREIETFKAWRISTLAIRTSRMIQFGDVTIVPDSLFIDNNLVSMIKARSFDLIVVDEAQRFLTEDSKRTKALFGEVMGQGIVHKAEKVILLSGTPMRRGPMELWPALHALAYNEIDFRSRHKYGLDFCDAHQEEIFNGRTAWNYKGASNLDILKEKIEGSFILTKKLEDHVKSLKGLLSERVVVLDAKLSAKTLKLDKSLQVRPPPLEKLVGSQGLGAIAEYRKLLSLEKVKPSAEYVKNILETTEESVLVFLHHTEAILAMEKALAKYNPAVIYGKVKTKDRDDIEKSFQAGKTRVLIANIGTMVGLNLTRASRCVFAESSWSSTDNDQARSRAFRIGQESRVVVDYITLANTLDEYVLSRVIKKRSTINKLF